MSRRRSSRPSTCRSRTRRRVRASRPRASVEGDAVDGVHGRAAARDPGPDAEVLDEVATSSTGGAFIPALARMEARDEVPGPHLCSCGIWERESSSARGQRSANAQPSVAPGVTARGRGSPGAGARAPRPRTAAESRRAGRSCTGAAVARRARRPGASSALRPAYMTSTRSAMSATTPRLCVIRTIAVPSRSRMSRIRSRIPAWIVTSSAVVGSSAISTFGSQASAIAIITRCRIPPESWCGYSSSRRSGAGIRTSSSSSIVRARAARARDRGAPSAPRRSAARP